MVIMTTESYVSSGNEYKVRIIENNVRRALKLSELKGLDMLSTPAWVYDQKKNEIPWANVEAMNTYFKRRSQESPSTSNRNSADNSTLDASALLESDAVRFYARVEEDGCTVHIVGPRKILLSGVSPLSRRNKSHDNEIVTLVVSPIEIIEKDVDKPRNATLFHEIGLTELQFESNIDIQASDTPLDVILRMLDVISAGYPVPCVHAKKMREVIRSGHDVHQPIIFAKSFMLSSENIERRNVIGDMLGINKTTIRNIPPLTQQSINVKAKTSLPNATWMVSRINVDAITDQDISEWNFDGFAMNEKCKGKVLSCLTMKLLKKQSLIEKLDLNENKLIDFILKIEEGYVTTNKYHNAIHAASVLHAIHMIMMNGGVASQISKDDRSYNVILLVAYIAAMAHDYRHQGVSNRFLIDISSPLAIVYNDTSPLENHHSASAFKLLVDEKYNFLESFSKFEIRSFRNMFISMILNTDMQHHFANVTKFKNRVAAKPIWKNEESDILAVAQIALKCADISHIAYDIDLHRKWVECLQEEMFIQGDMEKNLNIPVSPLSDRSLPGITSSQADFMDIVVTGMYQQLALAFPDTRPLIDGLNKNHKYWSSIV
jgi:hypothetical protein